MKIQYTDEQTLAMRKLYGYFIRAGDLVFNVGANEGRRTQIFLDLGASVVAIEPQPQMTHLLRERFSGKQVSVIQAAAGQGTQPIELYLCSDSALATCVAGRVRLLRNRWPADMWQETIMVPQVTLNSLIYDYGMPAFIKIDVEGYEQEVIKGLSWHVRSLCFEATIPYVQPAIECIQDLTGRLNYDEFNYLIQERMELVLEEWVSPMKMEKILLALPENTLCADVFAR